MNSNPGLLIQLPPRWQLLKGVAYGFRETTMLGRIGIQPGEYREWSALDAVMAGWTSEPLPPDAPNDPAGAMLHRLLHWQSALQRLVRVPVFAVGAKVVARQERAGGGSEFDVAVPVYAPRASIDTLHWLTALFATVMANTFSKESQTAVLDARYQSLLVQLRKYKLEGVNNHHFLHAAHRLDLPAREVLPATWVFGQGTKLRWLQSTVTDATPAIGVGLAASKSRTARLLAQHGFPVPRHGRAGSADEAVKLAAILGYPVVVKPDDREQGEGVQAGLRDEKSVRSAYDAARVQSDHVLVEKHHDGEDYRLTVFRDKVVKIMHRQAGGVTGNGRHTIEQLLQAQQQTPHHRDLFRRYGFSKLTLDDEALSLLGERGYGTQTIPTAGERIALRRRNNISTGGLQGLVDTRDVHPENLNMVIRATRAVQLDLCGVDVIANNLTQPWLETGAVIIEMNARPQIGVTHSPEVYQQILAGLLDGDGRIPLVVMVCETPGCLPDAAQAQGFARDNACQAVASSLGIWVDGHQTTGPFATGFDAARALLISPVASGLIVLPAIEIVRFGLPADRFSRVVLVRDPQSNATTLATLQTALRMLQAYAPQTRSAGTADRVNGSPAGL